MPKLNFGTTYTSNNSERYNSSDDDNNGCFDGNCAVLLANGSMELVKDIRRGDVLRTPDDSEVTLTYGNKIMCKHDKTSMVMFDSGLIITPWCPILIDSHWAFSHNIRQENEIECQKMYNFVLDRYHISL